MNNNDAKTNHMRQKIWEKWESEAEKFGKSREASWGDILIFKEIKTVEELLVRNGKILDLGCANGFSTLKWVHQTKSQVIGLDYSPQMIRQAMENKKELSQEEKSRVDFIEGDILKLTDYFSATSFEQAITKRVLTNLESEDLQIKAVENIHHLLKEGGIYICSEPTVQGLNALNKTRGYFGLDPITAPWHNLYLNEESFLKKITPFFQLIRTINFSSSYYFGSRIIYASIAKLFHTSTKHNSLINKLFLWLPAVGNIGVQKLFLFKKGQD